MRGMLKRVVTEGTGWRAGIDGYSIGGKTGTAEKQPRGNDNYILSFIGFAPVEDPKVVIYCVVDEPHVDSQYLSGAGAVVFNMIATELFPYMNIYKSDDTYEGDASDDEQVTPIYNGEAPDNDVAGGGVNDYESMGATSNSEGDFYVPTPTDADR